MAARRDRRQELRLVRQADRNDRPGFAQGRQCAVVIPFAIAQPAALQIRGEKRNQHQDRPDLRRRSGGLFDTEGPLVERIARLRLESVLS